MTQSHPVGTVTIVASRSTYGMGSIVELGDDRWRIFVPIGKDPLTGKYRRATKIVKGSRSTAQKELVKLAGGDHARRGHETLAGLLAEYLDARPDMSPSTRADFEGYIARSVPKTIATKKLAAVNARDLDALYLHLQRQGGVCRRRGVDKATGKPKKCTTAKCAHGGGQPLAVATVKRVRTIINAALEQAVKWDYIPSNPNAKTRDLTGNADEVTLPPADDLVRILAALDDMPLDRPGHYGAGRKGKGKGQAPPGYAGTDSPLPDFVALDLATGARPGELCALTWGQLDLDRRDEDGERYGRVEVDANIARGKGGAVRKDTKTGKKRPVDIDGAVCEVLERRRARWLPAIVAAGVSIDAFPVFPSRSRADRPWRPDSMGREFRELRNALGLSEDLTLRNLRHYCVSVLAASDVDIVTTAKRHGHSPQTMMRVYAHMFDKGNRRAAAILGANIEALRSS